MKNIFIAILTLFILQNTSAQDEGYIYGRVTSMDGNEYLGHFRWGGEETFWTDIYNASKLNTKVFGHLIGQKKDEKENTGWLGIDWSLSGIWEDRNSYSHSIHEFSCEFGNIVSIKYRGGDRLHLALKNGAVLEVGGSGYNDVRASITIYDEEIGKVKIRGSEVRRVDFMKTPKKLEQKGGKPLYGYVITSDNDSIVGLIEWDHDEKLDTEILDGETGSQDLEIPFGKISRVEPIRGRSRVILRSGRAFLVHGSNDVNDGNRGIIVTVDGLGHIDIPWSNVESVNFWHDRKFNVKAYDDFKKPEGLNGTVELITGERYKGYFAFDMDEVWEFEMLNAESHDLEFDIPFGNIKSIRPKNYDYSWVELKGGNKLLLGGSNDVSDDNGGILMFSSKDDEPFKIRWSRIDKITFN